MRLATKILAVSLTFIVLLTAVAGYMSVRGVYEEFKTEQRELARNVAGTINQQMSNAFQRNGPTGVQQYIGQLTQAGRSSGGAFTFRIVLLDNSASLSQQPRMPLEELLSGPFGDPISIVANDSRGERQLYTYVPLKLPWNQAGALEFTGSLEPLVRKMWQRVWMTLGAIGALAFASIMTAYFTGVRWVVRPLEKLIDQTERIGKGDFERPLHLDTNDELGDLATAINQMCVKLQRQQQTITEESSQRLAMLEQLRHVDRLKTVGRLAAGVGHELGTPLNVISGRAALINSGQLADDEVRQARIIKSEAERITGIVRQLLDFARPKPPQRTLVNLIDVIDRTVQLLEPLAEKHAIKIHDPVLEDPNCQAVANADPGQLQQVLTNIIVNAIQAVNAQPLRSTAGEILIELYPPPGQTDSDAAPRTRPSIGAYRSATMVREFRPRLFRISSNRSSPPRTSASEPGWGCRSCTALSLSMGGGSKWPIGRVAGPYSTSLFRGSHHHVGTNLDCRRRQGYGRIARDRPSASRTRSGRSHDRRSSILESPFRRIRRRADRCPHAGYDRHSALPGTR